MNNHKLVLLAESHLADRVLRVGSGVTASRYLDEDGNERSGIPYGYPSPDSLKIGTAIVKNYKITTDPIVNQTDLRAFDITFAGNYTICFSFPEEPEFEKKEEFQVVITVSEEGGYWVTRSDLD